MIRDLLNPHNANKKYIFEKKNTRVTVTVFNDFYIVYSSAKKEAKKYSLKGLDDFIEKLKKLASCETITYKN